MEFRKQDDELGIPSSSSLGYNPHPHPLRDSAFSKPILSPSSSLISPRGGTTASAGAGTRNGSDFLNSTSSQPPATLNPTGTAVDHSSSSSQPAAKTPDPSPLSNSSLSSAPTSAGVSSNSRPTYVPSSAAIVKSSTTATAATTNTVTDVSFRYRECLRNHAASVGGHVVDGCGEFMPNGDLSTPEGLKCAACGCHRSFHRKEADGGDVNLGSSYYHHGGGASAATRVPLLLPPPHPQVHHNPHTPKQFQLSGFPTSPSRAAPGVFAFGGNTSGSGGTTTESSSEERVNAGTLTLTAVRRKRFRTKFTLEQKEKMLSLAERIGWRIQKQDEAAVDQFCSQAGVKRKVLKVWMHNNKHTLRKNQHQHQQVAEQEQLLLLRQREQLPQPSPHQQQ